MNKGRYILFCWVIICGLWGCNSTSSNYEQKLKKELQEAMNNYFRVRYETDITFDETPWYDVASGEVLESNLSAVKGRKENYAHLPEQSSYDFKIERLEVIAYGKTWAVVEVRENYVSYSVNMQTGKKSYTLYPKSTDPDWRWRVQEYLLIKKEGKWKVDKSLDFITWSN